MYALITSHRDLHLASTLDAGDLAPARSDARTLSVHRRLADAMAYRRQLAAAAPRTRYESEAFEALVVVELIHPVQIGDYLEPAAIRRRWDLASERSTA